VQRFLGIFTPYRIDVQQGNFVSREMVNQLKEGMQRKETITPEQVRFVLGTPLLTDIFHANRWDYVFRLKKGSGEVISSRVTAYFKDNRLVGIDSGVLPTEQEYLAFIAGAAPGSAPNK
jgi:outer membrane protein assembly factor BamE